MSPIQFLVGVCSACARALAGMASLPLRRPPAPPPPATPAASAQPVRRRRRAAALRPCCSQRRAGAKLKPTAHSRCPKAKPDTRNVAVLAFLMAYIHGKPASPLAFPRGLGDALGGLAGGACACAGLWGRNLDFLCSNKCRTCPHLRPSTARGFGLPASLLTKWTTTTAVNIQSLEIKGECLIIRIRILLLIAYALTWGVDRAESALDRLKLALGCGF